jgi:hypothetical protein
VSPSSRWRRWTIAVAVTAVITVSGCTAAPQVTHSPSATSATSSAPSDPPPSPGPLTDPLEVYLPSPAEQAIIETGLKDAVGACLRRAGISVPASFRIGLAPLLAFEMNVATIAGSLPLSSAQRFGYTSAINQGDARLLALDKGWSVSYRLSAADHSLHARLQAALTGSATGGKGQGRSSDGCLSAGLGAVLGDGAASSTRLADDTAAVPLFLTEQAQSQMQDDPRVQDATKRWQECMSRAGYSYPNPSAAQSDPRWLTAAGNGISMVKLASMEKPVATADARCRGSAGYTAVRLKVFDDNLDRLIAEQGTKLRLQQFRSEVAHCIRTIRQTFMQEEST